MKRAMMTAILVAAGVLVSCVPPGTVTGYYENNDFVFTKINMPDGREVWVAKSKSPKAATTVVNAVGKATQYNCIITVDENGNEHITNKKPVK